MLAVCQGARAVILESAVVQIILRCVERTKQLRAKQADDKWHTLGDTSSLFGGQLGIESAKKISEALAEMLADFEGNDDVRSRFLNVAKSYDQSAVSLRKLQQSFGDNLDGLEAMRNNFDRCTEEVIRLVSLLEGDCASMRVQLHRTLKSPRERMSQNLFGGLESLGKSLLVLENIPQSPEDHISGLLDTLEHDLCDTPLTAMVQVAQDVNDHIVKQLSEKGRLEKLRPRKLSFDATAQGQWVSPARVIEEMFHTLKPCIFESANAMAEVDTDDPELLAERSETADLIATGGLVSPTRPPVDLSFARAQLSKVKSSSKESNQRSESKRKGSRASAPRTSVSSTGASESRRTSELRRAFGEKVGEGRDRSDRSDPLNGPLGGPLRQSRVPRPSDVPLSASSPDLPGLVKKDLQPKSVGSLGLNSSQSAAAKDFGDELKRFSESRANGGVGGVNSVGSINPSGPSTGDYPSDPTTSTTSAIAVATVHRDTSDRVERQDGRPPYGVDELTGKMEHLDPLQPAGRAQVRSADAQIGSSVAGHSDLPASLHRYSHEVAAVPLSGSEAGGMSQMIGPTIGLLNYED